MFGIRRKKTDHHQTEDVSRPNFFTRLGIRIAGRLQHLETRLNNSQKKILLALFMLAFGGYSAALLYRTITGNAPVTDVVLPQRMATPILQPDLRSEIRVTMDTVSIIDFIRVIDSLQLTPAGRDQVEHFFLRRPGMRDTLLQLQEQFNSTKKNSDATNK